MARKDKPRTEPENRVGHRLDKAKIWLFMLAGLGAIIVIFSVAVSKFSSGVSILGYVVGFFCLVIGAMAAFSKQDAGDDSSKPSSTRKK